MLEHRRRAAPREVSNRPWWRKRLCGNYQFGGDDYFLRRAATIGRKSVDKSPGERPSEASFREALEDLLSIAPAEGRGLIDQLAHRWTHPDCPPCLYVLTCTLRARTRLTTIVLAVLAPLAVWARAEHAFGLDLRSPALGDGEVADVGAGNVVVAALIGSALGWATLEFSSA